MERQIEAEHFEENEHSNDAPDCESNQEHPGSSTDGSQQTAYIPIRLLGRGAFGDAVLYRKVEVRYGFHSN